MYNSSDQAFWLTGLVVWCYVFCCVCISVRMPADWSQLLTEADPPAKPMYGKGTWILWQGLQKQAWQVRIKHSSNSQQ